MRRELCEERGNRQRLRGGGVDKEEKEEREIYKNRCVCKCVCRRREGRTGSWCPLSIAVD